MDTNTNASTVVAMSYQRQTPSKGTPERDAQVLIWEAEYAKVEAAALKAGKAKEARERKDSFTKIYDTLNAKYHKLQDTYLELYRLNEPLRKLQYLAHLEDIVDGGDEANRLAAMQHIPGCKSKDAWDAIIELARAALRSLGVNDAEELEAVSLDVASMITSYPGVDKPIEKQAEISLRTYKTRKELSLRQTQITDMDISDESKNHYRLALENAQYEPKRTDEVMAEAVALHDKNVKRKADVEAYILAGVTAGHATADELWEHLKTFSYDEATKSNRIPIELEEVQATIKRMLSNKTFATVGAGASKRLVLYSSPV